MRKYLVVFFAIITVATTIETTSASGLYFGPKVGINFSSFRKTSNATNRTRMLFGGFVGYKVLNTLSVQAEALYSMEGTKIDDHKQSMNYLKIPILAKLSLIGGLSAEAGVSFNMLVSSNKYHNQRLNSFDFTIPVGLTYTFLRIIEVGIRYDISLVDLDLPGVKDAHNSTWAISAAIRF